jgi:shikimate dehydrogenase
MYIDGNTRLSGLIGQNISHTLSPLIHNTSAQILNRQMVYVPFDVEEGVVSNLLATLWDIGAIGFNVTTPYKELVGSLIPNHPHFSSINTVYRGPDRWLATSTDGIGFEKAVGHAGFSLSDFTDYVFLGNGGSVVALVCYLLAKPELSNRKIHILRRTPQKDAAIDAIRPNTEAPVSIDYYPFEPACLNSILANSGCFLVVQGTSAPLRNNPLGHFANAIPKFNGLIFDLVYGTPSALLAKADTLAIRRTDGIPMLIEQARASQQLWWGESASYLELEQVCRNSSQRE